MSSDKFQVWIEAERAAKAAFLAACVGDVVELAHPNAARAALVLEDVREPGLWRVSTFGSIGALGHMCEPTRDRALKLARSSGYTEIRPGAIDDIIDWPNAE